MSAQEKGQAGRMKLLRKNSEHFLTLDKGRHSLIMKLHSLFFMKRYSYDKLIFPEDKGVLK